MACARWHRATICWDGVPLMRSQNTPGRCSLPAARRVSPPFPQQGTFLRLLSIVLRLPRVGPPPSRRHCPIGFTPALRSRVGLGGEELVLEWSHVCAAASGWGSLGSGGEWAITHQIYFPLRPAEAGLGHRPRLCFAQCSPLTIWPGTCHGPLSLLPGAAARARLPPTTDSVPHAILRPPISPPEVMSPCAPIAAFH